MAQLVVLYKTPKSTDAFDRYYFATHVPLAKKLPGLKKYDVSKGPVAAPAARAAFIWLQRCILTRLTPSKPRSLPPKGRPRQATSPILRMAARTFISLIRKTFRDPPQRQRPHAAVQAPSSWGR